MAKSLSVDLRRRVVDAVDEGSSCRAAAERFGVGVSSAIRWVQRARTRGDLEPDKRGGNHRSHQIDVHRDLILGWIDETPDLTLAEISERLEGAVGYRPLPSIVCRFFQRHGVTRKKKDGARGRAGARRHSPTAYCLVRGPAGSRPRASGLHRRVRHLDQDGPDVRPRRAGRAVPGARAPWSLERGPARHRFEGEA